MPMIAASQFVDRAEYVPKIDLTGSRLTAARDISEMNQPNLIDITAQRLNQIPLHDLDMVNIEQEFDVWVSDTMHNFDAVFHAVKEVTWVIDDRIQAFDNHRRKRPPVVPKTAPHFPDVPGAFPKTTLDLGGCRACDCREGLADRF